jgi:signal transduction histidine kinase
MITGRGRRLWVRAIGEVQVRAGRPRRLFGLIQDITERRRLEGEMLAIARDDRERAVRGLHDDLGQALTGMSLMLRCLSKRLPIGEPRLADEFETLIALMNRSIGTCRSLAKGLSPASASHGGLLEAVRELVDAFAQARGIAVRVRWRGSIDLTALQAEQLLTLVQGGIIWMGDHGNAARIVVSLIARGATRMLTVAGDCSSAAALKSRGATDLSLLKRRANLSGATLEVRARPAKGPFTRCTLRVLHPATLPRAQEAALC